MRQLNPEEMAKLAQQKAAGRSTNGAQAPPTDIISVKASAYKMTGIKWLWQDRFAIGKLGIIAGLPDEGKGQTLAYIAAQVTNGGKWPMNEGHSPQGCVVIFSDEDDPNDTLVPRLARPAPIWIASTSSRWFWTTKTDGCSAWFLTLKRCDEKFLRSAM
jgi:AAA domain